MSISGRSTGSTLERKKKKKPLHAYQHNKRVSVFRLNQNIKKRSKKLRRRKEEINSWGQF